jgi:Holliday junction resolvase RusA-like endonuclease
VKPDIDNIYKQAADACKALVFNDDKQIVFATMSKNYSERPSLRIEIVEINQEAD